MTAVVYILCSATSLLCAVLLLRGYLRSRARLLLWSGLCFVGLTLDNIVLFLDVIIFPDVDFSMVRRLGALLGLMLLIYGLIWDVK